MTALEALALARAEGVPRSVSPTTFHISATDRAAKRPLTCSRTRRQTRDRRSAALARPLHPPRARACPQFPRLDGERRQRPHPARRAAEEARLAFYTDAAWHAGANGGGSVRARGDRMPRRALAWADAGFALPPLRRRSTEAIRSYAHSGVCQNLRSQPSSRALATAAVVALRSGWRLPETAPRPKKQKIGAL
jgi:hypothetical protein